LDTTLVDLGFFVADEDQGVFAHARSTMLKDKFAPDLARWLRMVSFVRNINFFFLGGTPSLYAFSIFNPLNLLSLRRLSRFFRVSSTFWDTVVVPVYSSSFLTTKLDCVPAVIVPVLHDLIPLHERARMRTWKENSTHVFKQLLDGVRVETSCKINHISFTSSGTVLLYTDNTVQEFDRIVFACSADAVLQMCEGSDRLERALLGSVGYADDDDTSFIDGRVHSDTTVLPECYREQLLTDFANYIEVADGRVENTFILSSWIPAVRAGSLDVRNTPMLVTYNSKRPIDSVLGTVSNARAHPHMSPTNTYIALLLRLIQGRRNAYYCGSFATPGNGHDLSLLSGFAAAHAIGAQYPFAANPLALDDFTRLRRLMGL
jgi:predicted NAD/FAD-binding protein